MANLSNINNYFVINTSGLVAVGDASSSVLPSLTVPFTVFKSGADSILSIQSGGGSGKPYFLRSNTNGSFSIYDDLACLERLIIASGGDVTISKNLTVTGNTVTLDSSASAGFIVDRANDTSGATYEYKTNGSLKWYTGLRGVSTEDFYLFNNAQGSTALLISSSNNHAAFGGTAAFASNISAPVVQANVLNNQANSANIIYRSGTTTIIGGGSSSNKLYVLDNGDVGVNVSSPIAKLQVDGNIALHASSNAPYIDFVENGATSDSKARITMDQIDTNNGELIFSTEGSGTLSTVLTLDSNQNTIVSGPFWIQEYIYHHGDADTYIRALPNEWILRTGGSDRLTISDSNTYFTNTSVGIGITTPQAKLQVNGAVNTFSAHFGGQNNTNGQFQGISLGYAEAANASYRKVAIVTQAKGDGAARQDLHFLVDTVADSNSAGIADSKMSIQYNTGDVIINNNLGIGTTSPNQKLDVAGSISSGGGNEATSITHDTSGNVRAFVHNFSRNKDTSGASNVTLVDISGLGNFHQAMFYVQYGTRLQSVSDSTTGAVVRTYGVNRFNGGTLQVTETNAIAGSSNSITHALVNVEIVSNTQYRLRIEFSSTLGASSFATGLINGFAVGDAFPTITFAEGTAGE